MVEECWRQIDWAAWKNSHTSHAFITRPPTTVIKRRPVTSHPLTSRDENAMTSLQTDVRKPNVKTKPRDTLSRQTNRSLPNIKTEVNGKSNLENQNKNSTSTKTLNKTYNTKPAGKNVQTNLKSAMRTKVAEKKWERPKSDFEVRNLSERPLTISSSQFYRILAWIKDCDQAMADSPESDRRRTVESC